MRLPPIRRYAAMTKTAKELFLDAIELAQEERQAFLERAVEGNGELLARVQSLLRAHGEASALEAIVSEESAERPSGDGPFAGERIGAFELLEPLGEGGFGHVWRADQHEPVRRQVALKVLKAGLDTREVVARFEAERQALALMDHPGIARVYDGGSTSAGRPWFAMELVEGVAITTHCQAQRSSLQDRLELFLEVCRAVQHAHQKGVIHRDLKPSNVLVTSLDGGFVPKVIDFGIAKATGYGAGAQLGITTGGQLIGTPAYMSPEQISGSSDIDTRSDVYALGVLLYELLSGHLPFEESVLREKGLLEIQRLVCEAEPRLVSARIQAREGAGDGAGAPEAWHGPSARAVRGELDWIVMRCLEKDRERRYASTSLLADDLQRYLQGEAVHAGPPSVLYRARKFASRHRGALASLVLIFALLVAGILVSTNQARRARRAEALARIETERAKTELERYEVTSRFLEDLLLSIDPAVAQDKDTELLREVLDRAAEEVTRIERRPQVEARLRHTLGYVYSSLRADAQSEVQLRRALALREQEFGPDDVWTLEVAADLGAVLIQARRLQEAEPLLERVYEKRLQHYGPESESTMTALSHLAVLRRLQGRLDEAEVLGRDLERLRIDVLGELHADTITAMNNLAGTLDDLGRFEEAGDRYERALELNEELLGPMHPHTLAALNNCASAYHRRGRLEEALDLLLLSLSRKRELYERDHPSVLLSMNNVAQEMSALGLRDDAEALYREALEMAGERYGLDDRTTQILTFNLANIVLVTRPAEARELLEELEPYVGLETMGPDLSRAVLELLDRVRD